MRDAFTRHGQWHLLAFLKEIGCASSSDLSEPVSQAQFDRVKDNGLRALHPANQQGEPAVSHRVLNLQQQTHTPWRWPLCLQQCGCVSAPGKSRNDLRLFSADRLISMANYHQAAMSVVCRLLAVFGQSKMNTRFNAGMHGSRLACACS